MQRFLKRHNLTLKKASLLLQSRHSATKNPFIIYKFYDILESILKEKKFTSEQIWNADETGFPYDPRQCKVIGQKGKPLLRVTGGPGRQNTTVLACCNAAREALPPLLVFQGKNLQSTWKGQNDLKGTMYAVSENGWIDGNIFHGWLVKFTQCVKKRPLLLIVDGYVSHVSTNVIKIAMDENITLLKLPPHTTDLLQPLDVTCFAPLKKMGRSAQPMGKYQGQQSTAQ